MVDSYGNKLPTPKMGESVEEIEKGIEIMNINKECAWAQGLNYTTHYNKVTKTLTITDKEGKVTKHKHS